LTKDDPRLILREITDGAAFVMRGTFTLNMSLSGHNEFYFVDQLLRNITESMAYAFQHVISLTHDGSVLVAPSEVSVTNYTSHCIYERSALFIALNVSGPSSQSWDQHGTTDIQQAWYNITINSIHSKSSDWAIRDIVSRSTFKA
jgi:L-rhamnose mutarotase